MEKAQGLFFLLQKKEVWLFTLIQISFGEKKKQRGKGTQFHKEESGLFFFCTQFWFRFWYLYWSFPNLATLWLWKTVDERVGLSYLRDIPQSYLAVSVYQSRLWVVFVSMWTQVSRLQMFCNEKFFAGRLNKGVNPGHTIPRSVYQNHIYSLRFKLLRMILGLSCVVA